MSTIHNDFLARVQDAQSGMELHRLREELEGAVMDGVDRAEMCARINLRLTELTELNPV